MKDKPELDIFSIILLGGVGYMFYKLYLEEYNNTPVIKQAPTPISVPIPNPAPLPPISPHNITPVESPVKSGAYTPIERSISIPNYIWGIRQDATEPFDIYYTLFDGTPGTKVGRDYLIGINNPFTLTVFKYELTKEAKNSIGDTSLIEKANSAVESKLNSIVMDYRLKHYWDTPGV